MGRKLIYVVLDGVGDRPHPALLGQTPLEAAKKPHIDELAKAGRIGLQLPLGRPIAPESDVGVISILGYDAAKYYTGRGPLEAMAEGLPIKEGELAYRVNFATGGSPEGIRRATGGEGPEILDRRVGRNLTTQEATALAEEVNAQVKLTSRPATFLFKNTIGHRGVLIIRRTDGGKLSAEVSNTDPAYMKEGPFGVALEKFESAVQECRPMPGHERDEAAIASARLTNEFIQKSRQVLDQATTNLERKRQGKLPGNLILTRDGGDRLPKFPAFQQLFGMRFGCFVEMPVERGIALLTGMEVVELGELGPDLGKNYRRMAALLLEHLPRFDGLYIHIKATDEPGHDGDAKRKTEVIELVDEHFFGQCLSKLDLQQTLIALTGDHSTPCTMKAHSGDPVPVFMSGGPIPADGLAPFCERTCAQGSLKTLSGGEIMPLLARYAKP